LLSPLIDDTRGAVILPRRRFHRPNSSYFPLVIALGLARGGRDTVTARWGVDPVTFAAGFISTSAARDENRLGVGALLWLRTFSS